VKKNKQKKKSKSAATAAATSSVVPLEKDELCHLYRLVVPHQHVTLANIENLKKYVKDNNIRFRLTGSPSAEASDDEEPGEDAVDDDTIHRVYFDSVLRLWVIPTLQIARHTNSTLCFYHNNIETNKFKHNEIKVVKVEDIIFEVRKSLYTLSKI